MWHWTVYRTHPLDFRFGIDFLEPNDEGTAQRANGIALEGITHQFHRITRFAVAADWAFGLRPSSRQRHQASFSNNRPWSCLGVAMD